MFGLGWVELLVIGGIVMLIFGPTALRRLLSSAQSVMQAKNELTGPGALKRFLGDDEDEPEAEEDEDES